jgi:FtsZ-binding cell division protein ZapB
MKSSPLSQLSMESQQEFGALLLLDQLMRYDLLEVEKDNLTETVSLLEKEVAELKKGFFHSDEQDQELSFEKDELREAKEALSQVEKEMKENDHCRLNLALAETDDEGLEPLLKFMEERGTLTVSDDNFYQPTKKGREVSIWLSSLKLMLSILASILMWIWMRVHSGNLKRICWKVINGPICVLLLQNIKA